MHLKLTAFWLVGKGGVWCGSSSQHMFCGCIQRKASLEVPQDIRKEGDPLEITRISNSLLVINKLMDLVAYWTEKQ